MEGFIWIVILVLVFGTLGTLVNEKQFYNSELPNTDAVFVHKTKLKRELTSFNAVETLIVVDFSLYLRITNIISVYMPDVNDIITAIRNSYMILMERVNRRFSLLDDSEPMIRIVLTDLYVADSLANSPWNSTIQYTSEIVATRAMNDLNIWLQEHSKLMVSKNLTVIVLTAMKLLDKNNRPVQGISQNGSICTGSNVIILQETFDFILATVATHYIARSMGAHEDGKGNNCSADNHFIMSTPNMALTGETKNNPWRFSDCSIREITAFLSSLPNACFTRLNNIADVPLDSSGTRLTVDQQCKIIKGASSFMCRAQLSGKYEDVCTGMYCYNAVNRTCELVIPREGTLCGDKKWCINGVCVMSYYAPSAIDECVHGDQPVLELSTTGCDSYSFRMTGECYKENVRLSCCRTCLAIATGTKDCQYGDRVAGCASISGWDCYNETINRNCCDTCRNFFSSISDDCPYGDRVSWCNSISPRDCYVVDTNRDCCRTCTTYHTYITNCQYGDRVAGCASISGWECYNETINRNCCGTCRNFFSSISDCQYGDRVAGCASRSGWECYNETINRNCCGTCRNFLNFFPGDCLYGDRVSWCNSMSSRDCYLVDTNRDCCKTCRTYYTYITNCLYGDYVSGCQSSDCSSYSAEKFKQCCETCSTNVQTTVPTAIIVTVPTTYKQSDDKSQKTISSVSLTYDRWVGPVVGTIIGVVIIATGITSALCYLRRRQHVKRTQQKRQQNLKEVSSNLPSLTTAYDSERNRPPILPLRDLQGLGSSPEDGGDTYTYIYPNDNEDALCTAADTSVMRNMGYSTSTNEIQYIEPIVSSQYIEPIISTIHSTSFGYKVIGSREPGESNGYLCVRPDAPIAR